MIHLMDTQVYFVAQWSPFVFYINYKITVGDLNSDNESIHFKINKHFPHLFKYAKMKK